MPKCTREPRPPVELEPEVLSVTAHGADAAPEERAADPRGRDPLEDDRVVRHGEADDPAADRHGDGRAAGGLDLGQLGHRSGPPAGHARQPRVVRQSIARAATATPVSASAAR